MTPIRITPGLVALTVEPNDAPTTPLLPGTCAASRVRATARVRNRRAVRMEGH